MAHLSPSVDREMPLPKGHMGVKTFVAPQNLLAQCPIKRDISVWLHASSTLSQIFTESVTAIVRRQVLKVIHP